METGVITSESLPQLLRGISQRRRQGILAINYGDRQTSLMFIQGKVVDVLQSGQSPVLELDQLFSKAGWLNAKLATPDMNYTQYFKALQHSDLVNGRISEGLYKRVLKHLVPDKLYAINLSGGAYYTFEVQMIECERDFLPAVSIGQLLLDLVALEGDAQRFKNTFHAKAVIQRKESSILSEEEQALWSCLEQPLSVEELRAKALLSRYHFQDSMLAMCERGAIEVRDAQIANNQKSKIQALSEIDDSIDEVFAEDEVLQDENSRGRLEQTAIIEETLELNPAPLVESQLKAVRLRPSLITNLKMWNSALLTNEQIPGVILGLVLLASIVLPFLMWAPILKSFGP